MSEKMYTREQISRAVNDGADLVLQELAGDGERDTDLINMVVNSVLELLDHPEGMDLDEVIRRNYETSPEEVRSWWSNWS